MRSAKLEIDIGSIREYRMECTGDARSTVRTAARTAALVAAAAVLVTGLAATGPTAPAPAAPVAGSAEPPTLLVALPESLGVANRAW